MHKGDAVKEKLLEKAKQGSALWGTLKGSHQSHRPRNPQPPGKIVLGTCTGGICTEQELCVPLLPSRSLPTSLGNDSECCSSPAEIKHPLRGQQQPSPCPGSQGMEKSPSDRKTTGQASGRGRGRPDSVFGLAPHPAGTSSPACLARGRLMVVLPYPHLPPASGRGQKIPLSPSCSY